MRLRLALALLAASTVAHAKKPTLMDGGAQMREQAAWGGASGVPGIYYQTGVGLRLRKPDNSELTLGSGGGSTDLPGAYANGAAGPQVLTLDATRLGLELDGYASMATPMLKLKLGSTPGADALEVTSSTGTLLSALDQYGGIYSLSSGGGVWARADGLTTQTNLLGLLNLTAASAGTPVQVPGGLTLSGGVYDTGAAANKASVWNLYSIPVSANPGYGELTWRHNYGGAGEARALTLSSGSTTAATTGVRVTDATTSTPNVSAGHFVALGTPTCSVDTTIAGAGATCSISGNDEGGEITIVGGTGAAGFTADTAWITVTLAKACSTGVAAEWHASNNAAAAMANNFNINIQWYTDGGTGTWTIRASNNQAAVPASSTTYKLRYTTRCY